MPGTGARTDEVADEVADDLASAATLPALSSPTPPPNARADRKGANGAAAGDDALAEMGPGMGSDMERESEIADRETVEEIEGLSSGPRSGDPGQEGRRATPPVEGLQVAQYGATRGYEGYPSDSYVDDSLPLDLAETQTAVTAAVTEEAVTQPRAMARATRPLGDDAPRRRRGPLAVGAVLAAALVVALVAWLTLSTAGVGLLQGRVTATATATDTATATATAEPTATAMTANTVTPEPTSGPTQAQVDRAAYNSFSAVTLGTAPDGSCASNVSSFSSSGGKPVTIYINLCTSSSVATSSFSISIRQTGDRVCTVAIGANSSYNCFGAYSLTPGNRYDMLVTMRISGKTATARDLPFSVTA
jgi:hypothetical protein